MYLSFYIFSFLTIFLTILSIFQTNLMYSLFYFFVSVLTTSGIFFSLGDYMIGSLQIIIYSGAILVLFVFVVMLLNHNNTKCKIFYKKYHIFYLFFCISLLFCFLYKMFFVLKNKYIFHILSNLNTLGIVLFEPYILLIEFISILLLSIIVVVILISRNKK